MADSEVETGVVVRGPSVLTEMVVWMVDEILEVKEAIVGETYRPRRRSRTPSIYDELRCSSAQPADPHGACTARNPCDNACHSLNRCLAALASRQPTSAGGYASADLNPFHLRSEDDIGQWIATTTRRSRL